MPEELSTELLGANPYEIAPEFAMTNGAASLRPGTWLPAGARLGYLPPCQGVPQPIHTRQSGHIVALRYQTGNGRLTVFVTNALTHPNGNPSHNPFGSPEPTWAAITVAHARVRVQGTQRSRPTPGHCRGVGRLLFSTEAISTS
jgi:hypothetical protein